MIEFLAKMPWYESVSLSMVFMVGMFLGLVLVGKKIIDGMEIKKVSQWPTEAELKARKEDAERRAYLAYTKRGSK